MIAVILFALIVAQVTFSLIWAHLRAYQLSTCTWDQLIEKIEPVGQQGVRIAASDGFAHPHNENDSRSEDLWDLLGGSEGLRRLDNNARIMIALATYMERQNKLENMILAERMRRDGAIVCKRVRSIRIARYVRTRTEVLHTQLHDAARAYDAMKKRLPALYELSRVSTQFTQPLST